MWELQKDKDAFGKLDKDVQKAVNLCCEQGLVWR